MAATARLFAQVKGKKAVNYVISSVLDSSKKKNFEHKVGMTLIEVPKSDCT